MSLRELRKLSCALCKTFGLIYSLLTAKCIDLSLLIDYSTYFKEIQYINIVNSDLEVINNKN